MRSKITKFPKKLKSIKKLAKCVNFTSFHKITIIFDDFRAIMVQTRRNRQILKKIEIGPKTI